MKLARSSYLVVFIEGGVLGGEGLPSWVVSRITSRRIGLGTFPDILSALLEMFSLSAGPVAPSFSSAAAHFAVSAVLFC